MKLWGGRFEKAADTGVEDFTSSISFDMRLYPYDIQGSVAHATMLGEQGIISHDDAQLIVDGLQGVLEDIESGKVELSTAYEDIHMNIEALLTQRIGEAGKRLHTGRSRNDQIALDERLYVRAACGQCVDGIKALMAVLMDIAAAHLDSIMPGYTHLQKAQPVTLAHHLMAYVEMLTRDISRFNDCAKRANLMPLGSGALATTTYPLNRERVAALLGFDGITRNSIDSVADRDYMQDFVYACCITMQHLSRLCMEITLWATGEYAFIELDDGYSTGSSIMPQKKNPDVAELIRGKTGRVYGDLTALLTLMKGLPLAYNSDMQEDKEALFDAHDTLVKSLAVLTPMMATSRFNTAQMARAAAQGFTNATDLADYLVGKGLPFREAHEVSGRMVLYCLKKGIALLELSLEDMRGFSPLFGDDVFDDISIEACVSRRKLPGGPAKEAVETHIKQVRIFLSDTDN